RSRIERGEIATPNDRHIGRLAANGKRYVDGRSHLRSTHHAHADCEELLRSHCASYGRQIVPVDVAVDDAMTVRTLQMSSQGEQRQRESRAAPRRYPWIDEQNLHGPAVTRNSESRSLT